MSSSYPKNLPELRNPILAEVFSRLSMSCGLPTDCDPLTLAESVSGLAIPLTPVQRLILALIALSRRHQVPQVRTDSILHDLIRSSIGETGDSPRLWLPPGASIDSADTGFSCRFESPITLLLCVAGRRSGKTTLASILHAWLARRLLVDVPFLNQLPILPSSSVSLINVACDSLQARILFRMLTDDLRTLGLLPEKESPVERVALGPRGRIQIESLSSSSRSARGRTAISVCFDEFAHFQRTGGPLADRSMWLALTPSIATFGPDGLAIVTTSPSGRSGVVWELFQQRGVREGMLTVQFPTWEMNPHVTRKQLDEEFKRDETLARQEYGAEFLAPHGRFLNNDDIAACVVENPAVPSSDARWHMHVDLGLIHDATAIAIGIIEENTPSEDGDIARIAIARLEVLEGSPESPVKMTDVERRIVSIASDMPRKSRGTVTFDQFQSAFVVERLRAKGIDARIVPATARTNQESFALLRDLIATRRISFPDHPRLLDELRNLECTPTPNGFRVEAARGFTDDCADSIAMVAWLLSQDNRWGDMLTIIERRG